MRCRQISARQQPGPDADKSRFQPGGKRQRGETEGTSHESQRASVTADWGPLHGMRSWGLPGSRFLVAFLEFPFGFPGGNDGQRAGDTGDMGGVERAHSLRPAGGRGMMSSERRGTIMKRGKQKHFLEPSWLIPLAYLPSSPGWRVAPVYIMLLPYRPYSLSSSKQPPPSAQHLTSPAPCPTPTPRSITPIPVDLPANTASYTVRHTTSHTAN